MKNTFRFTNLNHQSPNSNSSKTRSSLLPVSYFHLLAHRLRRRHLAALGQSAPSFSPLGGVKPHTLDTYWAAAAGTATAARRQVKERGPRRMAVNSEKRWSFKMNHNKGEGGGRARQLKGVFVEKVSQGQEGEGG